MPELSPPANDSDLSAEIRALIATRNRPMLTALELCIEQLEVFAQNNPDVEYALDCARTAVALERKFQGLTCDDEGCPDFGRPHSHPLEKTTP